MMFDLIDFLRRQQAWSLETFGPSSRVDGIIDHIKKELREIEREPDDIEEWVDVIILALDGAWRSGHTPREIANALLDKATKNRMRKWPDWRTAPPGKAIEHIRE